MIWILMIGLSAMAEPKADLIRTIRSYDRCEDRTAVEAAIKNPVMRNLLVNDEEVQYEAFVNGCFDPSEGMALRVVDRLIMKTESTTILDMKMHTGTRDQYMKAFYAIGRGDGLAKKAYDAGIGSELCARRPKIMRLYDEMIQLTRIPSGGE